MNPNLLVSFYLFMTALFAALLAVPALRQWAFDSGSLDQPDERKVHVTAIPRLGGVAIFGSFLFSVLLFKDFNLEVRGLLAGGLIIFITGLTDDFYGISPKKKFAGQIFACLVTMFVGDLYLANLGDLFGMGEVILPLWLAIPFTLFAVVGVCNAVNLIDGLDGLAGGLAVIALGAFFVLDWRMGNGEAMLLCAALLGAILGFLKYNCYPARIFMGDVGSLLVGFVLAFLAIRLTQMPGQRVSPMLPVLILGLPIVDTIRVMGGRILKGRSPFTPDRGHLHHKFLDLGLQHRFTVLVIYGLSLFWTLVAMLMRHSPEWLLVSVYLGGNLFFFLGMRFMQLHRERFPIFALDSNRSLRDTSLFQALVARADLAVTALKGLVTLFLLVAVFAGAGENSGLVQIAAIVFAAGVGLLYLTRDSDQHFVLVFMFMALLLLVGLVDRAGTQTLLGRLSVGPLSDLLLLAMIPLVAFKIIFKRPEELFLSTSLDFLILAMSASLVILSPELTLNYNLPWVIAKGIVLFLAVKIIASTTRERARKLCGAVLVALLLVAVRGVLPL